MDDKPQGNGAPEAPQGTSAPEALTLDMVTKIVNQAISARSKSFEKTLEQKLSELSGKFQPAAPPPEESPEHPTNKGLMKRLEEMQKRLEAAENEKKAEQEKLRDRDLRSKVAERLAAAGIDGQRAKHAIGFLVDAQKSVKWDGETLAFGEVDFETGVSDWLKSEDAKLYLPPRGTSGSGDRPVTSSGRGNAPPDPDAGARAVLTDWFTGNR
jgi:hypothetical protein